MELKIYFVENNIKANAFAELLGIPKSALSRIANLRYLPRDKTLNKIEELTNGKITSEIMKKDFYEKKKKDILEQAKEKKKKLKLLKRVSSEIRT